MATRSDGLDQLAAEFCVASVADWTGKAARMLADTPELAHHSLATALVLGDVARVREEIERDPEAATRTDPQTGWTALHAVCASKWPKLDPDRTAGLVATVRLLLDAGADPNARVGRGGRSAGSSALRCAAAAASSGVGNSAVIRLLLERGATLGDDDLYLAAFGPGDHACLRALLDGALAARQSPRRRCPRRSARKTWRPSACCSTPERTRGASPMTTASRPQLSTPPCALTALPS